MSLWTQHETWLETVRQAIPGGPGGWHPQRLIFRDWWHWRDYELGFAHGRLALTGQNAGGKSSLLALAIPTLLDGDTSPIRLDPGLSRDRYLYWYLLGDDGADPEQPDAFAYKVRTGYLALEFRHGASGRYLTIGMGVGAARSLPRKIRDWCGFILPDRRLGRDLDVRGADGNCLPVREFSRLLAAPAVVTAERGEYRRQVNAHLFGMPDDDYQALISMLIQARRPKLGEQAGPEKVCALLRDSLPGVPAERLERVAEVVTNIEQYQRNLDDVTRRAERVEELDRHLYALAEVLVQAAAAQYGTAAGRLGSVVAKLNQARAALEQAEAEAGRLGADSIRRQARLAEITARLQIFRDRDDTHLPTRLTEAQTEERSLTGRLETLIRRTGEQEQQNRRHDQHLEQLQGRFSSRTQQMARELDRLGRQANAAGWAECARALAAAAEDLVTLAVSDPVDQAEAVRPDAALTAEGEQLVRAHRALAAQREAVERQEETCRQKQAQLQALRSNQDDLSNAAVKAEGEAERRKDELAAALAQWQEHSTGLDVADHLLATVIRAVQELAVAPQTGAAALVEPLRFWAQDRRRTLAAEQHSQAALLARAEVQVEELTRQMAEVQRTGVLPPARTPVREAARSAPEAAESGLRPLFHWVRFRPGVNEATAARVEAAALEANLLDLLLLSPDRQTALADAWLVPQPLDCAATLLDVLEPEPGAPAAVAQVLQSVGWGEGSGPRWIAPDGKWQNGIAHGQVQPWLAEAPGLIGEERREAARQRRLSLLRQARNEAEANRAQAQARQQELEQMLQSLEAEMAELEQLPWQAVFGALGKGAQLREQVEAARQRVEALRPEAEAALTRLQAEEARYNAALRDLPAARGLDREALDRRAGDLEQVVREIGRQDRQYADLGDMMRDHRERQQWRERDRAGLAALQADGQEADRQLTATRARVAALTDRLRDPNVAALQAELAALTEEQQVLNGEEEQARVRRGELNAQVAGSQAVIQERLPEEAGLRTEVTQCLERLRRRLHMHPGLGEYAQVLEQAGPVALLPRLPRPVDPALLEQETSQRRGTLQEYLHRHRDLLGDYRPTPGPGWETLTFYEEREALTATDLYRRLRARQEEYGNYVREEEQKLYQRIIYQGILDELRKLIRRAHHFTKTTNIKLRQLRVSNGEKLSLRLAVQPAELVPGVGIGQALEQMDQGSDWLSDERREVLLSLIRAEVDRIRQEARSRGEEVSYTDAIRQALDYRHWYEYQLFSLMPGNSAAVPIRSRGFGKRSTSAKALALAIPVIAGVAARYDAATHPDVPRIIALDEAFAGFDANNQVAYLQFLDDLGLGWILTCPDELPYTEHLSAAMAYRMTLDQNLHVAFPILWDGKQAAEPLSAAWSEAAATRQNGDDSP